MKSFSFLQPTKANKTSSRSHAVLQVNIKQRNKLGLHTHEIRLGKLYMIDLAGSERAAQTQNTGKRMVEGAHINRSLLALGNCINALSIELIFNLRKKNYIFIFKKVKKGIQNMLIIVIVN